MTPVDFIRALFRDLPPGAHAWGARVPGDPLAASSRDWTGFPIAHGARLGPLFPENMNCYIAVSSFRRGGRRRKTDFIALHGVMLDDIGTKLQPNAIKLPLSVAVETSRRNFQGWYLLAEPERSRERSERLINGLIASGLTAGGADPGMAGVTRYGRAPFGINGKHGGDWTVQLVQAAYDRRYTVTEIAEAYGVDLAAPSAPPPVTMLPVRGQWRGSDLLSILTAANMVIGQRGDVIDIRCPWIAEHTGRAESGTAIRVHSNGAFWFRCHHGHCVSRRASHLYRFAQELAAIARRSARRSS